MPDKAATVYWKTSQVFSRPGRHAINEGTGSHESASLNRAVIFAMEDLEESRRHTAWIVKADGTEVHLPLIEQIYAKLKRK